MGRNRDLSDVILIGDSIRMGYQAFVEKELEGEARVWGPRENGGTSANVLARLDEWVLSRGADVLHLNCGLHDLRKEFGADDPAVPLARYRANLEEIFTRVLGDGGTTLIWAATTPVNEEWHHANKGFERFEADVEAYNRAALAVAERFGVPVNDLFDVVVRAGRDGLLQPDGVHFAEEGCALLGKAVAGAVRAIL